MNKFVVVIVCVFVCASFGYFCYIFFFICEHKSKHTLSAKASYVNGRFWCVYQDAKNAKLNIQNETKHFFFFVICSVAIELIAFISNCVYWTSSHYGLKMLVKICWMVIGQNWKFTGLDWSSFEIFARQKTTATLLNN